MQATINAATHSLIVTVVNHGFSGDVIASVKNQSAKGATVVHARRAGLDKDKSFFGISINTEKEIVMMLVPITNKAEIMKAIGKSCGIASDAHGIIFSLPVNDLLL